VRSRLVRPEFWSDATVGKLPARTRLTYIGLWNIADDAGYFEWRIDDIGAALFRFESAKQRERHLDADVERLIGAGRVQRLACGKHGLIPTLKEWRIQGGTLNERALREHEKCDVHTSTAELRRSTDKYRSVSPSESLSESVSPSPPLRGTGSIEPTNERPVPLASIVPELAAKFGAGRQRDN
jgi:hypothetical protein